MERFFSVVVEKEDGRAETVRLSGSTPGAAFQQAKQMPGVRRVGKVAEVSGRAPMPDATRVPASAGNGAANGAASASPTRAAPAPAPIRRERAAGYDPKVGFVLTGPRVVIQPRRAGGEQPFRHLQAPPEQYGPPKPLPPQPAPVEVEVQAPASSPPVEPAPVVAEQPQAAPHPAPAAPALLSEASAAPEYRIYKSRRRDGLPYLLQRGSWRGVGGKRLFEAAWEKGFAQREQAERHLVWLAQSEREMAEVGHADDTDAADDTGLQDSPELDEAAAELDFQPA